jgi:hypothetical protein
MSRDTRADSVVWTRCPLEVARLGLFSDRITDAGLKDLKELTNLRSLILNDTNITDAGLSDLKEFKKLETLRVSHTHFSAAASKELKKTLPKLQAYRR